MKIISHTDITLTTHEQLIFFWLNYIFSASSIKSRQYSYWELIYCRVNIAAGKNDILSEMCVIILKATNYVIRFLVKNKQSKKQSHSILIVCNNIVVF